MVKVKNYCISLLISFCIISALLCVTAAVFAYTNIQDRHLQSFVFGAFFISNIIGSMIVTRKIREKGILYGSLFGILFCLCIYVISVSTYNGFFISKMLGMYFGISIMSGIIGGIIGVNI